MKKQDTKESKKVRKIWVRNNKTETSNGKMVGINKKRNKNK